MNYARYLKMMNVNISVCFRLCNQLTTESEKNNKTALAGKSFIFCL